MQYLSKGKRGIVYLTKDDTGVVVVKKERSESKALRVLHNEAYWLKILNKYKIGPRFIRFDDGLVMEYIKGELFVDWHKKHKGMDVKNAVRDIFLQCRTMDKIGVNKLEMNYPVKHIIMRKNKPIMIDFERCKRTLRPKNVTQFCQFLLSIGFKVDMNILKELSQKYKRDYGEDAFNRILGLFLGG